MLPDIHNKKKSQSQQPHGSTSPGSKVAHGKSKGGKGILTDRRRSQPKQSAGGLGTTEQQETVAWPGKDLLSQVLQLRPHEEASVIKMVTGYTQFLKSQISCDMAYARALEKEHMERSSRVFKLQQHVEDLQHTVKVCSAPSPVTGSATEQLTDKDKEIQRLEAEIAAVRAQAAAGKQAAAGTLREERAVNASLQNEIASLQAASKQRGKDIKHAQAQIRRAQVAIARKHPSLGVYDAIAFEESFHSGATSEDEEYTDDDDAYECSPSTHAACSGSAQRQHGSAAQAQQTSGSAGRPGALQPIPESATASCSSAHHPQQRQQGGHAQRRVRVAHGHAHAAPQASPALQENSETSAHQEHPSVVMLCVVRDPGSAG